MKVGNILQIALGVVAALSFLAFWLGAKAGRNNDSRAAQKVFTTFSLLSSLCIIGILPLATKHGMGLMVSAVCFDFSLMGGAIGGYFAGRGQRRGASLWGAPAFAAFLVIALTLGFVRSKAMELLHAAEVIGLTDSGAKRDEPKESQTCEENLKSLYTAFSFYVQDWDAPPPAENWMENKDLVSKVQKDTWLHCPAVSNGKDQNFGYAYNAAIASKKLGGKTLAEMPNAATTPLLYDAALLTKSAQETTPKAPSPGRHGGKNYVLYCDGSVKSVAP